MEPGLSPGYRHEEEEEGKEGLEEAGGRRRGSQPWLRRFLASSLLGPSSILAQAPPLIKLKKNLRMNKIFIYNFIRIGRDNKRRLSLATMDRVPIQWF